MPKKKQEWFEKYKLVLITVGCCLLAAIIICLFFAFGPGDQKPVVFSGYGVPHCPYCYNIVVPYSDYCWTCNRNFRWTNDMVRCPMCKGSGKCGECIGFGGVVNYTEGVLVKGETTVDENGKVIIGEAAPQSAMPIKDKPATFSPCWQCAGSTICPWCGGEGIRRFGNGPIEYEDKRR
jgi:hypothetical protein